MPIYLGSFLKEGSKNIQNKDSTNGHEFGKLDEKTIIWPKNVDTTTINPKNFIELKKQFKLDGLLMIDKLTGIDGIASIINHVNRSGQNFLRGNTPEGKYPQFPDMSKIYNKIKGLETAVVHTIGSKRIQTLLDEENTVWSESIGLIAPVAHYVGIKVFAIGGNNFDNIKQYRGNI